MSRTLLICVVALVLAPIPAVAEDEIFSDGFEWGSVCAWGNDRWHADVDGDTFGDPNDPGVTSGCPPPVDTVANDLDCDDGDPDVHPDSPEACDGVDNDCSGEADDVCLCWADNCHQYADCEDTSGGPLCVCQPGFEGDGLVCTDIDECGVGPYPCDVNADCTNYPGDYTCACSTGWEGDGLSCTDIDECAQSPCDPNATCENWPGDYSCTCNPGYEGDGFTCTPI